MIDSIEYLDTLDGELRYRATTVRGESYVVHIKTYYGNDHSLIAQAQDDDVPQSIADAVEEHVQSTPHI